MKFQKTCVVLVLSLLFAFGDQKAPSCANDVEQHLPSTETVTAVGSGVLSTLRLCGAVFSTEIVTAVGSGVSLGTSTAAVATAGSGAR